MPDESLMDHRSVVSGIAQTLSIAPQQVDRTVQLLNDGNTLPFIARYRKEATGGLDEQQIRRIEDQYAEAKDLADRKATVIRSIESQGQMTDELRQQILDCDQKQTLETIYQPFKPTRRTRAATAREKGLQPLADVLLEQRRLSTGRSQLLHRFVNSEKSVDTPDDALAGACDIVAETWAADGDLRQWMVERSQRGQLVSAVRRGKSDDGEKFSAYFDHTERVSRVPSHRILAMCRGQADGILRLSVVPDEDYVLPRLERRLIRNPDFEFAAELRDTVGDCYRRLLRPAAESVVMQELRDRAEADAIEVFAGNIRELLLAPPAGPHVTIGIDPGFRTGCKVAVVGAQGQFLESTTIYPTAPRNDTDGAAATLVRLVEKHAARFIAIGNGTASRETDAFVSAVIRSHDLQVQKVVVSESGASVYSASEVAIDEYPDLDLTVRGAISIAHRLQDPLAELVKIDPRAIGVGQYQHDVNQSRLKQALAREVESCVSSVGVNLNLASPSLLAHVPGIGSATARNIVQYRNTNGSFRNRQDLLQVPKLGPRAFEQAAGFLRVPEAANPLDNSAVHPESYPTVERIASVIGMPVAKLIGNSAALNHLQISEIVSDDAGEFTLRDIISELNQPGRDPRSEFRAATFADDIHEISDLKPGLRLEGVVTNVTNFGAFVDVGVHQDGLIHISQLADHFVRDPTQEVTVGQVVTVTVLEVDEKRRRISLSRRSNPEAS